MTKFSVWHDHKLYKDGELVTYHETRNASAKDIRTPIGIVVHGTFGNPFNIEGSISWNQRVDVRGRGSAHVYIDRDGVVHAMNRLNQVLWHAGTSKWTCKDGKTRKRLNNHFIGIELACAGPLDRISATTFRPKWDTRKRFKIDLKKAEGTVGEAAYPDKPEYNLWLNYTDDQIEALIGVCRALAAYWPTIDECITHHDCSPNRKWDCAPTLDMIALNRAVFDGAGYFDIVRGQASTPTKEPYVASSDVPGITITEAKKIMFDLGFRITDLNSPVVGKTVRASLLELQDDNNLPCTGHFDTATLELLVSGKAIRRPDPELDKLDTNTLRSRGSTTIAAADNDERIAITVPAVFTGVAGVDAIIKGQFFSGLSDMASGITQLTKPFGFEIGPWNLLIGCLVTAFSAIILVRARLRKAKRVADARSGKAPR